MNGSFFRPKLFDAIRGYNRERFMADLMAGIIVGIVALPLAIAFGIASGVSPETGLVTAIIGGFIVSFLGGSSVQIGGPTGAFIVIVYGIIHKYGIDGLIIATFIAGILLLVMGLLRLGTLIKFIPYPIVVGFTAGIALTIFSTQMNDLFGLGITDMPGDFIGKWWTYFTHFTSVNFWALGMGLLSIGIIIYSPRLTHKIPGSLIAIVLMTVTAYLLRMQGIGAFETIGDRFTISAQLPKPVGVELNLETIRLLFPSAFTIALLGAIESLLSASVADGVISEKHNSNTELIAQGAANIVVPFFGGIPVTGAIARTMTNINNGGRTPVAGIVHALVLLLILLFLGPLTAYIPMACLAGVLIMVSYNMSGWRSVINIGKGPRSDSLVMLVTFLLTVILDLTIAIEIGLLLAMLLFMKRVTESTRITVSKGKLDLTRAGEIAHHDEVLDIPEGVEVYEIEGPFFFGIANRFEETMATIGDRPRVRIIRMRRVPFMDSTGLHNLGNLIRMSRREGTDIVLSGVREQVREELTQAGIVELLGEKNVCADIQLALQQAHLITKK